MFDTKQMRGERAELITKAQKIMATAQEAKRSLTSEDNQEFDRLMAAADVKMAEITRMEKLNEAERSLQSIDNHGIGTDKPVDSPEAQKAEADKRQKAEYDAYRSYVMTGRELEGLRAVTVAGTSGYSVPDMAMSSYVETLANFTDIRQAPVTVITTTAGGDLPIPTFNDSASDADETTEGEDVGDGDDFTAGQIVLKSYMTTTGVFKVSEQYIRDSAVDAVSYINMKLAERLARRHNKRFSVGTGTGQAKGIATAATIGKTLAASHATAIGVGADAAAMAKDLTSNIDALVASVIRPYRQVGKTGFMMNDNTALHIRGYTDSTGRGLWTPSLAEGEPDRLRGYPVWINNDLADIAANALPIVFGNFSYYHIRYVGNMLIKRLNERYAEKLLVGFLGYHPVDANLLDTAAVKSMKMSA